MKRFVFLGVLSLVLSAGIARAGDEKECDGPNCRPPTKDVCFNVVCHYEVKGERPRSCKAASTFIKKVTKDGGEVEEYTEPQNSPKLEVSCDGHTLFSNHARLFTDLLGTRIQGQTGPDPAILLPRGALHSGEDGQGGGHYSESALELDEGERFERGRGKCFIWTGYP